MRQRFLCGPALPALVFAALFGGFLFLVPAAQASILYSQIVNNVTSTQSAELPWGQATTTTGFNFQTVTGDGSVNAAQYVAFQVSSPTVATTTDSGYFSFYSQSGGSILTVNATTTLIGTTPTTIIIPMSEWSSSLCGFGCAGFSFPTATGGDLRYYNSGMYWDGTVLGGYFAPADCFTTTLTDAENCFSGGMQNYYAQIENTTTANLYEASNTSADVLKTLPSDWIINVASSTDGSGDPMTTGSDTWFKVIDPTDGTIGWMVASDTNGQYISSYDGGSQDSFASSSEPILSSSSTRAAGIVQAVNDYYANIGSSSVSLYNPDLSAIFSTSTPSSTFPEDLVFAIAAHEDGGSFNFNNEQVAPDYGLGIMQITTLPTSSDIYNLQVLLNKDPATAVATNTAGVTPNHVYDNIIKNSVETFQTNQGVSVTGIVGHDTLAALNALLPTSSIPTDFKFHEAMQVTAQTSTFDEDRINPGPDHTDRASGIRIPPCEELNDISDPNYVKNCYAVPSSGVGSKVYAPQPNYNNQTFKYYSNSLQSIYSNIKDGLHILKSSYHNYCNSSTSTTVVGTTTFQCYELEWILTSWNYNGDGAGYPDAIASKLNSFSDYVSPTGTQMVATSSFTSDLANKFEVAQDNSLSLFGFSPINISMTDSEGRITGMVNGQREENIPTAAYNDEHEALIDLFPNNVASDTYQVVGTDNGTYGLEIVRNQGGVKQVVFAPAIPISLGVIHTYTVDWGALSEGKKGVTIKVHDPKNVKLDKVVTTDALLSNFAVVTSTQAPTSSFSFAAPLPEVPKPPVVNTPPVRIQTIPAPVLPTSTFRGLSTSTIFEASSTNFITSTLEMDTSTPELDTSTIEFATSTENNSSTQNNE